ncbi:MAG: selenocysteine-specific translation elongation factor [Nitriliruptorales bacterium]|nr:selenocysteine-specific translation elongation factor [Nitriliruptorales bacterium]
MHVVATAGHVDHGKSTLLRVLTGMEPDRWQEERDRGLTIDLGFVWTELDGEDGDPLTVAFVDVPGHEKFIANMLAGAGGVRHVLFVVAADDGWSAQSQEHLDILDLLDVHRGVIAITKTDLTGEERAHQVADDTRQQVAGTGLADAPLVLTDALAGRGIEELAGVLHQQLASAPPPPDRGRPRLWVDRSFTISGAGTVVTGTLHGGGLATGDEVRLLPAGQRARIRGMQSLGETVESAGPGTRVACNLGGISTDAVSRGDAVVGTAADWLVTEAVDTWVRALPGTEIDQPGAWHLHAGSAEVVCTVHPLLDEPIAGGAEGWVRLELDAPLPLASGDRFVLREAGRRATVGGGEVVDPDPGERVRGSDRRLERTDALERVLLSDDRLTELVAASGGARPARRARAAAQLPPGHELPEAIHDLGEHLVHEAALTRWRGMVEEQLRSHHEAEPDSPGRDRVRLARSLEQRGCSRDLAPHLIDHLVDAGVLHRSGSNVALATHADRIDAAAEQRASALVEILGEDPLSPPKLDEAAARAGVGYQELQRLEQEGRIVRCGEVAFTRAAVDDAVARLEELYDEVGAFTAAQAKDAWGTTRRYAIPLLEHLDAVGVTDFDGRLRELH